MDFAVCPSCGQSVLDDDAEDCPFCGASMKAKPGAKASAPAKPAATKPAAPTAKPTAKPGGKPDAKSAADDFPFDADMLQPSDAIAASATATKGRSLQVLCPMCETAGFVPTSAAGKMVKCANPKCMVPLFRAPAPAAPKPVAPPPPPPKNNLVKLGIITTAVVAALGVGAYVFVSMSGTKSNAGRILSPEELKELGVSRPAPNKTGTVPTVTPEGPAEGTSTTADAGPKSAANQAALKAAIHKSMNEWALLAGGQNRSKPLCRRLAAEALAIDGQIKSAREQIGHLGSVGRDVPFYRVVPWVEVAWAEIAAKNAEAAKLALNSAITESASLPKSGRDRLITATYLAAALAGTDRLEDAWNALKERESSDVDGELAFAICWLTFSRQAGDLEATYHLAPLLPRATMQTAATTAVLTLRGQSAEALKFARSATVTNQKRDAFAGWIEAAVWLNPAVPLADLQRELEALTPVQRGYLLARAARVATHQKNLDAAKALVTAAHELLMAEPVPKEFTILPIKPLMKWKPTSSEELLGLATAIGEVAVAQHEIGDSAAAEASLNRLLDITRAVGPALALPAQKQSEIDGLGLAAMRDKLKKELELRSDDDTRQALGVYRQIVTQLTTAARTRFDFQSLALSRAAALGLEKTVWNVVSQRTSVEDPAQIEPYFESSIPSWLLYRFQKAKLTDDANTLTAAFQQKSKGKLTLPTSAVLMDQLLSGTPNDGINALAANRNFKGEPREAVVLRGVAALIQTDATDDAWALIAKQEIGLREQAYQLAALLASRKGKADIAWKRTEALNGATEKESIGRGVIAGLRDSQ